jgi:hypothetical protein
MSSEKRGIKRVGGQLVFRGNLNSVLTLERDGLVEHNRVRRLVAPQVASVHRCKLNRLTR